jgi:CRP/FNR family transcriptional regulator
MSQKLQKLIPDFLAKVTLFTDLNDGQRTGLAKNCIIREFARNKPIFYEGDLATGLYIVFTGQVKVFKATDEGKEQIIQIFKQFDLFGEAALFESGTMPVNATTLEPSTILIISKDALLKLIAKEPEVALKMLAIQAKKLRFLTKSIEELTLIDAEQRLVNYLILKAKNSATGNTFKLDIAKTTLATLLGTSRENLSRMLSKLQNAKIITIEGNKVTVLTNY